MRFSFPAKKDADGYTVTIKRDGTPVASVWSRGTKSEAQHEARIAAESYGYVDGVS